MSRDPLRDALERTARIIEAWGRPAALIGGAAMIARVHVRATGDVDLLCEVEPGRFGELSELAVRLGFVRDPADLDLVEAGLLRFWLPPDRFGLDVLAVDDDFTRSVVARATPVCVYDFSLPVASLEDLLLLKLDANRGVDWDDAIAIKDAFGSSLDRAYIFEQAERLDIGARVRALLEGGD